MSESIYKILVYKGGRQAYPPLSVNTRQSGLSVAVNTEKGLIVSAVIKQGSLKEVALKLAWKDVLDFGECGGRVRKGKWWERTWWKVNLAPGGMTRSQSPMNFAESPFSPQAQNQLHA